MKVNLYIALPCLSSRCWFHPGIRRIKASVGIRGTRAHHGVWLNATPSMLRVWHSAQVENGKEWVGNHTRVLAAFGPHKKEAAQPTTMAFLPAPHVWVFETVITESLQWETQMRREERKEAGQRNAKVNSSLSRRLSEREKCFGFTTRARVILRRQSSVQI